MCLINCFICEQWPFKRDRKWVTGCCELSQVNQEVEAHDSKTASLATCFCLKISDYISCLMKHRRYVILSYVLSFNYSALFVILRVVCEFEDNIISVNVLYTKWLFS